LYPSHIAASIKSLEVFVANMHPWRGKHRVIYQLTLGGEAIARQKVRTIQSEAQIILGVAEEIEAAINHRLPHKDSVAHWISLNMITPSEAEEMFVGFEAPTDLKDLNEDAWSIIMQAALREKEAWRDLLYFPCFDELLALYIFALFGPFLIRANIDTVVSLGNLL
jgi:hypothetical protein